MKNYQYKVQFGAFNDKGERIIVSLKTETEADALKILEALASYTNAFDYIPTEVDLSARGTD